MRQFKGPHYGRWDGFPSARSSPYEGSISQKKEEEAAAAVKIKRQARDFDWHTGIDRLNYSNGAKKNRRISQGRSNRRGAHIKVWYVDLSFKYSGWDFILWGGPNEDL